MPPAAPQPPPYDGTDLLSIIRMLPDVVFRCVKGADGKIYWTLNEGRLAEEFGLTTEQIQGKSLEDLFPGGASAEIRKHFEDAFEGRPGVFINEINGRFFKHYPQPVYGDDGQVEALVGFITEVTESVQAQGLIKELNAEMMRRVVELNEANDGLQQANQDLAQANQDLAQANQDLDAFAFTVSHDLRTPLTVIQNLSHVLRLKYGSSMDDKGRQHLEKISRAATRMDELVHDVLRFSRASRSRLEPRPIDVTAMVEEIADQLRTQDPGRRVAWDIQRGVVAEGDPGLVRSALENLLGNAWKYTREREDARISFGAEPKDGLTWYVVEDNGIGFDEADAQAMFEAFTRLDGSKRFEGTGIGLATVKRIVERHGGRIVASGEPGRRATFAFTLAPPSA